MPRLNHTGPQGQGARTGRQMGNCKPNKQTTEDESQKPMGLGRKNGRGGSKRRGFGSRFNQSN